MGAADRHQGQGSRVLQALGRVLGERQTSMDRGHCEDRCGACVQQPPSLGRLLQCAWQRQAARGERAVQAWPKRRSRALVLGLNAKSMMLEGGAPSFDFQYAIYFACFCKNNVYTEANRQRLSSARCMKAMTNSKCLQESSRPCSSVWCTFICTRKSGAA